MQEVQPQFAEMRSSGKFRQQDSLSNLPTPHANSANALKQQKLVGQSVPLLLKPNGVPVFQNLVSEETQLAVTMPRNHRNPAYVEELPSDDQMQRTVKAHSFLVGKKITNVTEIAKTTCPEEQAMPIKIVYVKPGLNRDRPPTAPRQMNAKDAEITLKRPMNANTQLEREISLGDISGIFKEKTKKRVKSAADDERKKLKEAQRKYAEQVRLKAKEQSKQERATGKQAAPSVERKPTETKEETTMKTTQNVPHATNRFHGKYDQMTKDLFRKAQEKVKQDRLKEQEQNVLDKAKRDKSQQVLAEIQERNRLLLAQ